MSRSAKIIGAIGVSVAATIQGALMGLLFHWSGASWVAIVYMIMCIMDCLLVGFRHSTIKSGGEGSFYRNNFKCIRITTVALGSIISLATGFTFAADIYAVATRPEYLSGLVIGILVMESIALFGHLVNTVVACCWDGDQEQAITPHAY